MATPIQPERRFITYVVGLYSLLFVASLAFGYYLLFSSAAKWLAASLGVVIALLAWNLGRLIARMEGGIRAHAPMFALLLLISAVGIFNSLFLNLESRTIFTQRIDAIEGQFRELLKRGPRPYDSLPEDVKREWSQARNLGTALVDEIVNQNNCGQGPRAQAIITDLQRIIPFVPLSVRASGCVNSEEIADRYRMVTIPNALQNSRQNQQHKILDREKAGGRITEGARKALASLSEQKRLAGRATAVGLIQDVKPQLETQAETFDQLKTELAQYAPSDAEAVPAINLSDVRALGEWSQLVSLVASRFDKATTYVYCAMAVFADWMLVYLYALSYQQRGPRGTSMKPRGESAFGWSRV